jgi:hypothetical protein
MKNKMLVVGICIFALVLVGGLWFLMDSQGEIKPEVVKTEDSTIEIQYDTKFGTRLTEREIAHIKNSNDFVWYEVPELKIKFKVTPDTKDDLKYITETGEDRDTKEEVYTVYFYSQSVVNFLGSECVIDGRVKKECADGSLGKVAIEKNLEIERNTGIPSCNGERIVANINNDIICLTGAQASVLVAGKYEEYLETIKSKEFGIYLNTTEEIK